jgi:hypothetical protein
MVKKIAVLFSTLEGDFSGGGFKNNPKSTPGILASLIAVLKSHD